MSDGMRLARAAETFVGVPFRLHGRDPAFGLDCVGLVAASLQAIGRKPRAPAGYRLRNASILAAISCAPLCDLEPVSDCIDPGDILLTAPGPGQNHLMIAATGDRLIHAHAGLRRVVAQPRPRALDVTAHWRLIELK